MITKLLKELKIFPRHFSIKKNNESILIVNTNNGKIFDWPQSIDGDIDYGWRFGIRKDMIEKINTILS